MKQNRRILLKLSGEALMAGGTEIYNVPFVEEVAKTIGEAVRGGVQVAIVVGAGNIWRGRQGGDMDRTSADRMGMLATVINSICLKEALERTGTPAVVLSCVPMSPIAEDYEAKKAIRYLEEGKVVLCGAGTGMPFFSTDTAGAVRARELDADAMLMAKNVDYIYTANPKEDPTAEKIEKIRASEMLARNLTAIDATATAFCMTNGMPIRVFGLSHPSDILRALSGDAVGTVITPD